MDKQSIETKAVTTTVTEDTKSTEEFTCDSKYLFQNFHDIAKKINSGVIVNILFVSLLEHKAILNFLIIIKNLLTKTPIAISNATRLQLDDVTHYLKNKKIESTFNLVELVKNPEYPFWRNTLFLE